MVLSEPATTAETTDAIATPPTVNFLRFVTMGPTPSSLDRSLSTSNRVLVTTAASETAHASAKKTVYGVERRATTYGLLLCFLTSTKKNASPAKSHTHAPHRIPYPP
jgi:hypothetical protein